MLTSRTPDKKQDDIPAPLAFTKPDPGPTPLPAEQPVKVVPPSATESKKADPEKEGPKKEAPKKDDPKTTIAPGPKEIGEVEQPPKPKQTYR